MYNASSLISASRAVPPPPDEAGKAEKHSPQSLDLSPTHLIGHDDDKVTQTLLVIMEVGTQADMKYDFRIETLMTQEAVEQPEKITTDKNQERPDPQEAQHGLEGSMQGRRKKRNTAKTIACSSHPAARRDARGQCRMMCRKPRPGRQ